MRSNAAPVPPASFSRSAGASAILPLLLILVGFEIGVSLFGPLLPQVQREFRLSAGTVALALSIYNGIRLLFNIPLGRLVARSALPRMLAAGGGVMAAGAVVVAAAPSFAFVLAGRAIMGVGSALFFVTIQMWISRAATGGDKAQLFSLYQIAALTGTALGPALGGAVAGWLSWRSSLALAVAAGLWALVAGGRLAHPASRMAAAAGAAAGAVGPEAARAPSGAPGPASPARPGHLRLRRVLGPGVGMMASFFFHGGVVMTLIPLFAAREIHLGPAAIGGVLMLGTVQRFGSALLGGRMARAFGTRRVVVASLVVLGLSVLSFTAVGSPLGLIVAVSLVSWANLGGGIIVALVTDLVPEAHWGTALGINRTMGDLGAMAAPLLVGFVTDAYGFDAAFVAAAGVLLAAAGLAAVLTAAVLTAPGAAGL